MREFLQQLAALNVKFDQLVSRTPPEASSNRQKRGGGSEASSSTSFGTIQSRTLKLHLPHFEGGGPSRWVYRAEQFFTYHQMTPKTKGSPLLLFHLEGEALQCY